MKFLFLGVFLFILGFLWFFLTIKGYRERGEKVFSSPKTWKYLSAPKGLVGGFWLVALGVVCIYHWFQT